MRLYSLILSTSLPNYITARIPVQTGLNIPKWRALLWGYHDTQMVDHLEFGWLVDYTADKPPGGPGPYSTPMSAASWSFSSHPHSCPMTTIPKKNTDERRATVDLSFPRGASVNSSIRRGQSQGLPGMTDLADKQGHGVFLWSADLARAYRHLRTSPLYTPLLGHNLRWAILYRPCNIVRMQDLLTGLCQDCKCSRIPDEMEGTQGFVLLG